MKFIDNGIDAGKSGIYLILNEITGQVYVGSTVRFSKRYNQHKRLLATKTHHNERLQYSFNKYGVENFAFEIVEVVEDISGLLQAEQNHIDWYSAIQDSFNLSKIAGKVEHTKEVRRKISLAHKGKIVSAETRQKMSDAAIGKVLSESTRNKIRDHFKGRVFSEEHKQKIRKAKNVETYSAAQLLELQTKARANGEAAIALSLAQFKALIKDYISGLTSKQLAIKYGCDPSIITRAFQPNAKMFYTEYLIKIGFEGSSIKDLRKPEIQAKLLLD